MPNLLSVHSTPLVDRDAELTTILALLADPEGRLLTLSGPAGIGKTRLAMQVALKATESFPGRISLISLAAVTSPDLLVPLFGNALDLSFFGSDNPEQQLLAYLRHKEYLFILDHYDQAVLGSSLVAMLLRAAPAVKFLVTSRAPLGLEGERTLALSGLPLEADGGEPAPAVQLFLQTAHNVRGAPLHSARDIDIARHICEMLEGVPLAIELTAGWSRQLSCADIASEVQRIVAESAAENELAGESSPLPRLIHATWALLSDEERGALRKLVVFRGGFRREAAPRVAGAALPLLTALVSMALLRQTSEGRYELQESVRGYVQSRLNRHPEEQEKVQNLHTGYYADFLHYYEQQLRGERQLQALAEIGEEIENIRIAWRWAVEMGSELQVGKFLEALTCFYQMRGWLREAEESLGLAVEVLGGKQRSGAGGGTDAAILGKLHSRYAHIARLLGRSSIVQERYRRARPYLERAVAQLRQRGDKPGLSAILRELALVLTQLGDEQAEPVLEEGLSLARECGDRWGSAAVLAAMGELGYRRGFEEEARQRYIESAVGFDAAGDRWSRAGILLELASLAASFQDQSESRRLYDESSALFTALRLIQPPPLSRKADS